MPTDGQHSTRLSRRGAAITLLGTGAVGATAECLGTLATGSDHEAMDDDPDRSEDVDGPLTEHPYTGPPPIIDLAEQGFESTLQTVAARHQRVTEAAGPGPVELPEVWAFTGDDHEPSVPGPIYRVPEGETVKLTDENTHSLPHTIHVHAVSLAWADDGAPETTGHDHVDPGDAHTCHLEADVPGTHLYHCHVQTDTHLDVGMYGIFRVIPEDDEPAHREYFLTLRDWETRLHKWQAGGDASYSTSDRDANTYTINGRSAPSTFHPELGSPVIVGAGETVRVHLVNAGYESHPFHTHRHRFEVVAKDGSPVPPAARYEQDVIDVAPAARYTIEFEAEAGPGIYPAHCHKVQRVTTEGAYPGGMATAIVYEEAMETDAFAAVMADAAVEG